MKILVTGGLGYIGSHTVVELAHANHEIVIADNLYNSKIEVLAKLEKITGKKFKFYQYDMTSAEKVEEIFVDNSIDGVIHFAGLKSVGESVTKPLHYYYNNLLSTITLAEKCLKHNVNKFVFSSSATVYGNQEAPFSENMELMTTTNPYGETKVMSERILSDITKANKDFKVVLLRYFNPIGAHSSGLIGEEPNGIPNNLMPYITKVAKKKLDQLSVFGDDYDTIDGTGVRDYIHVVDLAKGHVRALETMTSGVEIYNLGTGKGTSVLELIESFKRANNIDVPYQIVDRRPGDIASAYAATAKVEAKLDWKATKSIEEMCRDSWNFEKNLK
ncbi:MAG: UDP-glucose 4-epimerase GalE [Erysipelotrichaceae bacterium]